MKNLLIIILFICACTTVQAQINLVLNPSFEQYSVCPNYSDELKYCSNWMSLDSSWNPPDWAHDKGGIPDYCNTCASSPYVTLPSCTYFYHYPRTGNGLIALTTFNNHSDTFPEARSYAQGHLIKKLVSGRRYNVFFYTTRAQSSSFATNGIGAYLDDGSIDTTIHPGWTQSQYAPQIYCPTIINDVINWIKVESSFLATGIENIITIGNFSDLIHTNVTPLIDTTGTSHTGAYSWYLIDDVSVVDCDNIPFAGNDTLIHPGDSAWLGPHEILLPYTWYKLGSTTPIDSGGGIWVKPIVSTSYVLGQKLCDKTLYDTVRVRVWPDTVTNVAMAQLLNGSIYPSPTKGLLTVEGVNGCTVSVYDVLGREVLGSIVATEKEVLDLEQLVKGVYMVVVTDRVTGFRVVREILKE